MNHRQWLAAALVGVWAAPCVTAQVLWQVLGAGPGLGSNGVECYDLLRDRVVAYGPETWEYDGSTWTRLFPAQSPIFGDSFVYDPVRQRGVLLGTPMPGRMETWTWDGINWTLVSASGPSARTSAHVAWHAGRQRVMLFGGVANTNPPTTLNDLWEWDGVAWSQVQSVTSPPIVAPPFFASIAHDVARDVLVAFAAIGSPFPNLVPETWEWNAVNGWQSVGQGGCATSNRLLFFDEARRRMVVIGTNPQSSSVPLQVWEREGTSAWAQRTTTMLPPSAPLFSGVYDGRRSRTLLMHYNGLVYAYGPTTPARYEFHGVGCPGTAGTPELSATNPWTLPWLGEPLNATIRNLPLSVGILTMGFSDTISPFGPLPLSLASLGMPNCFQRSAVDASVLLVGTANRVQYSLQVPGQPAFTALRFFQQAVVLDPGLNALGASVSNSVRGVIGAK